MKLLVTGATGLTGGEVVRQALLRGDVSEVVVFGRRALGISHQKLQDVAVANFLAPPAAQFAGIDACIWALGVSQLKVGADAYVEITHDYTLATAGALWRANPSARFCFVSGRSADPTEKKAAPYARIKGRTERHLCELAPGQVFNFRPGYIRPTAVTGRRKDAGRFFAPLGTMMSWLSDDLAVDCNALATALITVAANGFGASVLDNRTIRAIGGQGTTPHGV